jgi:hypothetical protein
LIGQRAEGCSLPFGRKALDLNGQKHAATSIFAPRPSLSPSPSRPEFLKKKRQETPCCFFGEIFCLKKYVRAFTVFLGFFSCRLLHGGDANLKKLGVVFARCLAVNGDRRAARPGLLTAYQPRV